MAESVKTPDIHLAHVILFILGIVIAAAGFSMDGIVSLLVFDIGVVVSVLIAIRALSLLLP